MTEQKSKKIATEERANPVPYYAVGVTPSVMATIKTPDDPVGLQYLPQEAERDFKPEETPDPIGDDIHSPVPGIVHRHTDRVLFKPVHACAVYCRFCFRRDMVGPGGKALNFQEIEIALDYIRAHKEIREVILTGGDPLILSPRRLQNLLLALDKIEHLDVLRIHTRVPVADPPRMTLALLAALKTSKPLYVVLHVNHTQEISKKVERALDDLHESGCVLLSQSVLLKGVNNTVSALEDLFRRLVALRVKPYYLHHADLAQGTSHFRTSIEEGQDIMEALRARLSGLCLPDYVLDIPGGFGKVPVGPGYLETDENGYIITDHNGATHHYPPRKAQS